MDFEFSLESSIPSVLFIHANWAVSVNHVDPMERMQFVNKNQGGERHLHGARFTWQIGEIEGGPREDMGEERCEEPLAILNC